MGEQVDRLACARGMVGTWRHRFYRGLSMDNDNIGSRFLCKPGKIMNLCGRNMSDLDSAKEFDPKKCCRFADLLRSCRIMMRFEASA